MGVGQRFGAPATFGRLRRSLTPVGTLRSSAAGRRVRPTAPAGRCAPRRAETVQFREGTLRSGELFQTGGHRSFLGRLVIVVRVGGDRQMGEIERPQIAVEDLTSEGEQSLQKAVEVPEIFEVAGFVVRLNI